MVVLVLVGVALWLTLRALASSRSWPCIFLVIIELLKLLLVLWKLLRHELELESKAASDVTNVRFNLLELIHVSHLQLVVLVDKLL